MRAAQRTSQSQGGWLSRGRTIVIVHIFYLITANATSFWTIQVDTKPVGLRLHNFELGWGRSRIVSWRFKLKQIFVEWDENCWRMPYSSHSLLQDIYFLRSNNLCNQRFGNVGGIHENFKELLQWEGFQRKCINLLREKSQNVINS